jgi:enoyl-CoA hydratase
MTGVVQFERSGHVAIITLNRPEARNAVNPQLASEFEAAVDELEADDDLWVGLLTSVHSGEPPVFCAGADLKAIQGGGADALQTERGGFAGFVYRERSKPVVAAIDGLATSGGCEIALACDIVVASKRAGFGLAEVRWNLVAGAGGLFRLPSAVGSAVALDMIMTAEAIDGTRAHQLGLVSRLTEDGGSYDEAMRVCEKIAANGPQAVRESRAVARMSRPDEAPLREATEAALAKVLASEDLKEGLAAFVERRAPRWTGR